jgi:hypothetical protein
MTDDAAIGVPVILILWAVATQGRPAGGKF